MNFWKKFFRKKKESKLKHNQNDDMEKWLQFFENADDNKIIGLEKFSNKLRKSYSPKKNDMLEFVESGLQYNKEMKAQKIVNRYGQAITEASELNKKKIEEGRKKTSNKNIRNQEKGKEVRRIEKESRKRRYSR